MSIQDILAAGLAAVYGLYLWRRVRTRREANRELGVGTARTGSDIYCAICIVATWLTPFASIGVIVCRSDFEGGAADRIITLLSAAGVYCGIHAIVLARDRISIGALVFLPLLGQSFVFCFLAVCLLLF